MIWKKILCLFYWDVFNRWKWKKVKVKSLSRVQLCDPMDCSPSGSSVHGIFQARVLEWTAISFSRGSSRPRNRSRVSRIAGRHFTVWATREALPPRRAAPNQTNDHSLREMALVLELWTGRPKDTGRAGPRHRKCERSIRQQIREALVNIHVMVSGQLIGWEFRADETGCLQRNKLTVKKRVGQRFLNRTEKVLTIKE